MISPVPAPHGMSAPGRSQARIPQRMARKGSPVSPAVVVVAVCGAVRLGGVTWPRAATVPTRTPRATPIGPLLCNRAAVAGQAMAARASAA